MNIFTNGFSKFSPQRQPTSSVSTIRLSSTLFMAIKFPCGSTVFGIHGSVICVELPDAYSDIFVAAELAVDSLSRISGSSFSKLNMSVSSLVAEADIARKSKIVTIEDESGSTRHQNRKFTFVPFTLFLGRLMGALHRLDYAPLKIRIGNFLQESTHRVMASYSDLPFTGDDPVGYSVFTSFSAAFKESSMTREQFDVVEREKWLASYRMMRQIIPPTIFRTTLSTVIKIDKVPKKIAARIWENRALWLICMHPSDILQIYKDDLNNRYSYHSLDIVEMRALWHRLPHMKWIGSNDAKGQYCLDLRRKLDELEVQEIRGTLPAHRARHPVYAGYEDLCLFDPDAELLRRSDFSSEIVPPTPGATLDTALDSSSSDGEGEDERKGEERYRAGTNIAETSDMNTIMARSTRAAPLPTSVYEASSNDCITDGLDEFSLDMSVDMHVDLETIPEERSFELEEIYSDAGELMQRDGLLGAEEVSASSISTSQRVAFNLGDNSRVLIIHEDDSMRSAEQRVLDRRSRKIDKKMLGPPSPSAGRRMSLHPPTTSQKPQTDDEFGSIWAEGTPSPMPHMSNLYSVTDPDQSMAESYVSNNTEGEGSPTMQQKENKYSVDDSDDDTESSRSTPQSSFEMQPAKVTRSSAFRKVRPMSLPSLEIVANSSEFRSNNEDSPITGSLSLRRFFDSIKSNDDGEADEVIQKEGRRVERFIQDQNTEANGQHGVKSEITYVDSAHSEESSSDYDDGSDDDDVDKAMPKHDHSTFLERQTSWREVGTAEALKSDSSTSVSSSSVPPQSPTSGGGFFSFLAVTLWPFSSASPIPSSPPKASPIGSSSEGSPLRASPLRHFPESVALGSKTSDTNGNIAVAVGRRVDVQSKKQSAKDNKKVKPVRVSLSSSIDAADAERIIEEVTVPGYVKRCQKLKKLNLMAISEAKAASLMHKFFAKIDEVAQPLEMLTFFVDSLGADVNARDDDGSTPLHCVFSNELLGKFLVSRGADIFAVDSNGDSVLTLCVEYEYSWIAMAFKNSKGFAALSQTPSKALEYALALLYFGYGTTVKEMILDKTVTVSSADALDMLEKCRENDMFERHREPVETYELLDALIFDRPLDASSDPAAAASVVT